MTLLNLFQRCLNCEYKQIENSASYFNETKGDTLYLYFEASNGKEDWKNNFDFPAKPYKEMNDTWFVHRGFLRVWKTIEPNLAPFIEDRNIKHIVCVGYSHGAAIAVLAYEYCMFHRPDIKDNIEGYGFGCPRVVWGFLKKRVKERLKGFVVVRNGNDLVTHLPPVLFGFRHVGKKLKIGEGKRYGLIGAHYPDKYVEALMDCNFKR